LLNFSKTTIFLCGAGDGERERDRDRDDIFSSFGRLRSTLGSTRAVEVELWSDRKRKVIFGSDFQRLYSLPFSNSIGMTMLH
jgi:hypothetical protein